MAFSRIRWLDGHFVASASSFKKISSNSELNQMVRRPWSHFKFNVFCDSVTYNNKFAWLYFKSIFCYTFDQDKVPGQDFGGEDQNSDYRILWWEWWCWCEDFLQVQQPTPWLGGESEYYKFRVIMIQQLFYPSHRGTINSENILITESGREIEDKVILAIV